MTRPSTAALILAVLAVVVPFALYSGGYFWLGEYDAELDDDDRAQYIWRNYQQAWIANMYKPASKLESWLCGIPVQITCPDDGRL
jgi:hypothetical protein